MSHWAQFNGRGKLNRTAAELVQTDWCGIKWWGVHDVWRLLLLSPQVQQFVLCPTQRDFLYKVHPAWQSVSISNQKSLCRAALPLGLDSAVERCKCVFVWDTDFHDRMNWQVNKSLPVERRPPFSQWAQRDNLIWLFTLHSQKQSWTVCSWFRFSGKWKTSLWYNIM